MDQLSFLEEVLQGRVGENEAGARDAAVAAGLGKYFDAAAGASATPSSSAALALPAVTADTARTEDAAGEGDRAEVASAVPSTSNAASGAGALPRQSSRERLRREAAAALSAQLSVALSDAMSREALEAVPDVASRLRVRVWLLIVLRKVRDKLSMSVFLRMLF